MIWLQEKIKKYWEWLIAGAFIPVALAALPVNQIDNITGMEQAEEAYFQTHGRYLQIISDNRLPPYESGTVKEKLGKDVAPKWRVDVYETPKKEQGWQVRWEDANGYYSKGYGPEALARTYIDPKTYVASTTAAIFRGFSSRNIWDWKWFINSAYAALSSNSNSTSLDKAASQYWSITDAAQTGLDFTGDLTFAMNVRFATLPGTHTFIDKRNATGNNRSYEWLWDSSNIFQFTSWNDGLNVGCGSFDVAWTPSANTWYLVSVTKVGTTVRFYVNKVQQGADQTCTNGTIFNGNALFTIGARSDGTVSLDGLIDDVRVWSRQLSGTEISDLNTDPCIFNDGASLQGEWLFDNNGNDNSANANNLTNNNSATFSTTVAYACAAAIIQQIQIIDFEE